LLEARCVSVVSVSVIFDYMSSDEKPVDNRNIIDHYKYWKHEAILADQDKNRCELIIACENFANDFNIATVIRSSNAFLCKKVYIIGNKRYDRRGCCGSYHYEHLENVKSFSEVLELNQEHVPIALDNIDSAQSIYDYSWPEKAILLLGQESIGITQESLKLCNDVVYIQQHGAVRSLNVGSAASIAMSFYRSQFR
jgi:tRNA G18 (ribose-2'-O)-methylase SpoU